MIIWGSKAREKEIGDGQFFCPRCHAETMYTHVEINRYFTLYFIPLFRTQFLADYVQCHNCHGQFDSRVLTMTPEQITDSQQPWTCSFCGNTNPGEYTQCIACQSARAR
jgi:hypothetical protein